MLNQASLRPAGELAGTRDYPLPTMRDGQELFCNHWTAPGEHHVSAGVRVLASREPSLRRAQWLTLSSAPIRVRVAEAP